MFDVQFFLKQPFFYIIPLLRYLFFSITIRCSRLVFLFIIRSAGGGQVLARLWRVGRSMFDVHLFYC